MGVDFLYNDLTITFPQSIRGSYSFSSVSSFLTGTYSTFTQTFGNPVVPQTNPNVGFYGQDEWQVNHRLTVNAGVRYDLEFLKSIATNIPTRLATVGVCLVSVCPRGIPSCVEGLGSFTTAWHCGPWPSVSVVVPVYRSEAILPELVQRLSQTLPPLAQEYELILVNDCSPDDSWAVISQLQRQFAWIRGINLMRNYGQHNALLCGIRAARYEVIITMDDDLQHPPEEIPKLLTELSHGFDVVYGTPQQEQHGLGRDLASLATKMALRNIVGAELPDRSRPSAHFAGR